MATDRSLTTLLRALQTVSNHQDSTRLLASATVLLRILSNPRNISLLTSQLLCAPAIWQVGDRSRIAWRVMEAFATAASHILRQDDSGVSRQTIALKSSLSPDQWVSAILRGIDDHTPPWRQVVLVGALLQALNIEGLPSLLDLERGKLSLNLASTTLQFLQQRDVDDDVASTAVMVVLSSVFNSLDQSSKALLRYEELVPLLYKGLFFGQHGLHAGYFLSNIDNDVVEAAHRRVQWPAKSQTFQRLREMSKSPIVAHLGPLSSLLAYGAASVTESGLIRDLANALVSFSRSLNLQWRQNKLSEIALSDEISLLTEETLQDTLPALWQILRVTMSAIIVILRSVTDRMLFESDPRIAHEIASNILFTLRNLYFISFRLEINLSSQYTYVYLASIDVLSQAPRQATILLESVKPLSTGVVPSHPLDRCNDLCFLNIAEHLTAVVPTNIRISLLLPAAQPYLGVTRDPGLIDILEAAHSVVLSTFAASEDVDILETHVGSYVDTLFQVFPAVLSSRQFRLAIKTLVRLTAPPAPIAARQPLLSSTLLEVVRSKLSETSSGPRSPPPSRYARSTQPQSQASQLANGQPALSEQAVYEMAMIDSIPYLPLSDVRAWLQIVAESLPAVVDEDQRLLCQARIWKVLSSGELDLDHSAICVRWWTTEGGKETVMGSLRGGAEPAMMSGALVEDSRL